MYTASEVRFYTDLMIIEAVSLDPIHKTAGIMGDLTSKVKDYVSNNIDPNDKVGSLFNILGPGAIALTFRAMGLGWWGTLIGFAMRAFHIDIGSIIESIWRSLMPALRSGSVSSTHVDSAVASAVQSQSDGLEPAKTSSQIMRDARLLKLALVDYEVQLFSLTKDAAPFKASPWSSKGGTTSVLGTLLSVLFKVALASAGLMVAGDVVNKFLGKPNALDGTVQHGHPVGEGAVSAPSSRSKQTRFPLNPGYSNTTHSGTWAVSTSNDPSSIANMLVTFAKEVYSGLDGKESSIMSSSSFQKIQSDISWYNHASAGDKVVIIPKEFSSKKDIVDYFIDDVARNAQ